MRLVLIATGLLIYLLIFTSRNMTEAEWQDVIFVDEKCFKSDEDGKVYVWRANGTRMTPGSYIVTSNVNVEPIFAFLCIMPESKAASLILRI